MTTRYKIKPYSYEQAKKLGVEIDPATNPKYKIDIFTKEGDYITSIGARGYKDYPTYLEENGKQYADARRALYHHRHKNDMHKVGTRGWFAGLILW
jgi:hypothetical protein